MKNNIAQESFDYMMGVSGDILKLSESCSKTDKKMSYELNIIASNMADFSNKMLEKSRIADENTKNSANMIYFIAGKLCGVADYVDLNDLKDAANFIDKIEYDIKNIAKSIIDDNKESVYNNGIFELYKKIDERFNHIDIRDVYNLVINSDYDLIIFRCQKCIDDLNEYNPYVYDDGTLIPINKIKIIEVGSSLKRENNESNMDSHKFSPIALYKIRRDYQKD